MNTLTTRAIRPRPTAFAALAAAVLLMAAPAAAADPDPTALDLRRQAMTVASDGDLAKAADFLVRTAGQLADDDPERDDNLRLAARLYHHAGKLEDAWRTAVNAGVAAYRLGDAGQAGGDLADATVVAVEAGNAARAWSTAQKVGYVLRTSDVPPEVRRALLQRITIRQGEALPG